MVPSVTFFKVTCFGHYIYYEEKFGHLCIEYMMPSMLIEHDQPTEVEWTTASWRQACFQRSPSHDRKKSQLAIIGIAAMAGDKKFMTRARCPLCSGFSCCGEPEEGVDDTGMSQVGLD